MMNQVQSWGVTAVIQDWLASVMEYCPSCNTDVYTARQYHLHMAEAARGAGLSLEYCMPLVSDIMQTLENPAATNMRLSDDYSTHPQQWNIGRPSIITWALGVAPAKDVFWTQSVQPLSPYGEFKEPNPELQAIVASLSTAPVAFGDRIGYTNATLIKRTCMKDGTLLRPAKPARTIDRSFKRNAPTGDIWSTYAEIDRSVRFHYIFATNLSVAVQLELKDVLDVTKDVFYVYEYHNRAKIMTFDQGHGLQLPESKAQADKTVPYLYVLCPVLSNGWILLGEREKFVAVAPQRFSNLNASPTSLEVTIAGSLSESVTIDVLTNHQTALNVTCLFTTRSGNTMRVHCSTTQCQCN
jgi:hypothetical protein